MLVRSLRLRGFRNYAGQEIELPAGLVALIGDNGQGKTNLLEALCVLATTKSPLVDRDRELIRWGEKEARLAAEIELTAAAGRPADRRLLEYSWRCENTSTVREMRAGGVPQSQIAQWLGQLQVVAFFPHDLAIITGEPEERRRFLNLELGKTRPAYFTDSARFRRALKQRNALLRHMADTRMGRRPRNPMPDQSPGTLAEWNRQVVAHGARVLAQRASLAAELGPLLTQAHRDLCGRDEAFAVEYVPGVRKAAVAVAGEAPNWSALLAGALEFDHETDMRRGTTQSGPHRDDLAFKLAGIDLRRYGSQGQQRLAVLALKIALAHWVLQATGEAPVLLLDDALSELDAERRLRLLQEASRFPQSVLTATDAGFLQDVPATFFKVAAGSVRQGE